MVRTRVGWRSTSSCALCNLLHHVSMDLFLSLYECEVHRNRETGTERDGEGATMLRNAQDAGKASEQMSQFCKDEC